MAGGLSEASVSLCLVSGYFPTSLLPYFPTYRPVWGRRICLYGPEADTPIYPRDGLCAGAIDTLCGQAWGARNYRSVGVVLQRALLVNLAFAGVISIAWLRCAALPTTSTTTTSARLPACLLNITALLCCPTASLLLQRMLLTPCAFLMPASRPAPPTHTPDRCRHRRSERLFLALGQEAELAAAAARYMSLLAPALPCMGVTEACKRVLLAQVS